MGQKAPDRRSFGLCSLAHREWHDLRGCFAGWTRERRRAWETEQVEALQLLATPEDRESALALQEIGLGKIVELGDGRWEWLPGPEEVAA